MTETASLVIKVDSSGADRATRNLRQLDRAADNTGRAAGRLKAAWAGAAAVIGSVAVAGATRAFIQQADAFANMSARLRLVTESGTQAAKVQRDLFELSQRTSTGLEDTTELYVRLAQASDDLRNNQERLFGITETVSKSMIVSGSSASEAASSVRQFSQAMASGVLRGDEFNSIMENSPRLARAIADGLQVPVGALRKMAEEGELTADRVIAAVESQSAAIEREFGKIPLTVSRATQQVKNALLQMIGTTDQAEGASRGLAESIADLARTLESESVRNGFAAFVSGVVDVTTAAATAVGKLNELWGQAQRFATLAAGGTNDVGDIEQIRYEIKQLEALEKKYQEGSFLGPEGYQTAALGLSRDSRLERLAELRRMERDSVALFGDPNQVPVTVIRPGSPGIRDEDLRHPLGRAGSTGSGNASAPQITEQAAATRELSAAEQELLAIESAWADERQRAFQIGQDWDAQVERGLEATDRLISDMQFELSLIGKSNEERAKAIALRYAGVDAASAEGRAIADWAVKIEQGREAEAAMLEVKRATSDLFADVISGSMSAGDAFEAFGKRLVSIAAQVIADKAVQALFEGGGQSPGATGGGGFWGSLVSGIASYFGGGRAGGGPVMAGQSYRVLDGNEPEIFTPSQNGTITPLSKLGGQRGGYGNVYIYNQSGQPARTEERPSGDGSGMKDLLVFIEGTARKAIGKDFATGTGVAPIAQRAYGLQRQGYTNG